MIPPTPPLGRPPVSNTASTFSNAVTSQPMGFLPSGESSKCSGKMAGGAAVEFGADGVEIHEPAL